MKILGMMSGTSFDGIDSALCDFNLVGDEIQVKVLAFKSCEYSTKLHKMIVLAMPPLETSMENVCKLDTLIGKSFASAAQSIIDTSGIEPDLIVSHGQTMFHWIENNKAMGTLQIGEPSWIAEATGIQVLSNIRSRDVAAGGHGAPLVSVLDELILSDSQTPQGALNLGGISNITITSRNFDSIAYDIGPANGLMDSAILAYSQGELSFDKDGVIASQGVVDLEQLQKFLDHPYYKLEAPKSTGKEIFHLPYIESIAGPVTSWNIQNLMATLLQLTVETVAQEVEKHNLSKLYVAGGGARNPLLMKKLQLRLKLCQVVSMDELGIATQAKEAVAFALIGFLSMHGLPGQIPSCTGASGGRILGSLTPGKNPFNVAIASTTFPQRIRVLR